MLSGSGGIGGGSSVQWSKPAALVCHICGREYGTASLKIHIPQCEKMWEQREALKPRSERRPLPKPTATMGRAAGGKLDLSNPEAMAAYNDAATKQFNEKAMKKCPNCGRTFLEDRLPVHLRSCRPGNEAARVGTGRIKSASEATAAATPMKTRGPGQVYGASSGGGGGSGGMGGQLSPSAGGGGGGYGSSPASAAGGSGLKKSSPAPRGAGAGAGVSFADQQSPSNGSSSKTPRTAIAGKPGVGRSKAPAGSWEDDVRSDDDDDGGPAPPSKGYSVPADDGGGDDDDGGNRVSCSLCSRAFNEDRIAKHEQVCRKQQASNAKRAAKIAAKRAKLPQPGSQASANTEAWKSKHNEFQAAIQYAKKMTAMQKAGVSLASLPPPPRSENADYITCPHCDRRFNQQAGERHIASCKNTINKPKAVGVGKKPPAPGSMAAQREAQAARQAPSSRGGPVRAMPTANGYGAGAYVGGDEYGGYSPQAQLSPPSHARPGSSGGMQPRSSGGMGVVGGRPVAAMGVPSAASGAAKRAPSPAAASRGGPPGGARQPSYGGGAVPGRHSGGGGGGAGDPDLHAKINQLTETVQMLSKAVLSPTGGGVPSARRAPSPAGRRPGAGAGGGGGGSCRSCGQLNPVASAKFCPHCGSRS